MGGKQSNLAGLTYLGHPKLPEKYKNTLLIADHAGDRIILVDLKKAGTTYTVKASRDFVKVSRPIDVFMSPSGTIYIATRLSQRLYRVRYKG